MSTPSAVFVSPVDGYKILKCRFNPQKISPSTVPGLQLVIIKWSITLIYVLTSDIISEKV